VTNDRRERRFYIYTAALLAFLCFTDFAAASGRSHPAEQVLAKSRTANPKPVKNFNNLNEDEWRAAIRGAMFLIGVCCLAYLALHGNQKEEEST
jgi:hypothetical protein